MRLLSFLVLLLMAAPLAAADWTSFHANDRNTGHSTADYAVFKEVWWNVPTANNVQIEASPVVAQGIVIVADWGGTARGLDGESGKQLWSVSFPGKIVGTPAISADRVFVASASGDLRALDLRTGVELAKASVGATQASITVHEGKLFIGNDRGEMKAYDTQTLTRLWTFKTSEAKGGEQAQVDADGVFQRCTGGAAHPISEIRGAPAVYQGQVIFGSFNHYVYAVDEEGNPDKTTDLRWAYQTGDIVWSSPAIDHSRGNVIVGSYDDSVYAFRATAGSAPQCGYNDNSPTWSFQVPSTIGESKVHSSPAVDGERVYFGANNGNVYALDAANGNKEWEFATGDEVFSSPAVADGIVVIGSDDKNVYWLDAADGSELKDFATEGAVKTSPAIDGMRAFAASFDGVLYMFGPEIPARPDLVVLSLEMDGSTLTVTVQNKGDADAGATILRITADGSFLAEVDVPALPAGIVAPITHKVDLESGPHLMRVVVDPDNLVAESEESNNEAQESLEAGSGGSGISLPGPGVPLLVIGLGALVLVLRRRQ